MTLGTIGQLEIVGFKGRLKRGTPVSSLPSGRE